MKQSIRTKPSRQVEETRPASLPLYPFLLLRYRARRGCDEDGQDAGTGSHRVPRRAVEYAGLAGSSGI